MHKTRQSLKEIVNEKLYQLTRDWPFYFLKIDEKKWVTIDKSSGEFRMVYNKTFKTRRDAAKYLIDNYNNGHFKKLYKTKYIPNKKLNLKDIPPMNIGNEFQE